MSAISFLRELLAAGLDLDAALIAAEKFEAKALEEAAAKLARRREQDAERKRQSRVRNGHAESRGVTRTDAESRGPLHHVRERSAQVVIASSSLRSEEIGGDGGECVRARSDDWPEGKPTDHMRRLIDAVGSPWLDPSKSHGLVTTSGRLAAWKRDGASWEHDVVPVVTALCAKQRGPVSTWKFFDQAIGRSVADNRAALEIPEAGTVRATGPPSFADRIAAEKAEARRMVLGNG